jgi:uncharacterized phage-like protein YoqJ
VILAVTGHRPNKLGNEYSLHGPYTDRIKSRLFEILDEYKPDSIISGMALGVDQIWAICGIRKNIQVTAAIPFKKQESRWPPKSQSLYFKILDSNLVTPVIVSTGEYTRQKMQIRNQWMVDECDKLVAVWDGTKGGTANCVKYAQSVNKEIIRIDPNE